MDKTCPYPTLNDAQKQILNHEKRLSELSTAIAVINAKLNIMLAILSAVGVSLLGVAVQLLFKT